jgi:glycosyltransferase involved in cell wall biosynthesis
VLKALAPRYDVDAMTLRAGDLPYVERYLEARMLRVPVSDEAIGEQVEAFRRAVRRQVEGNEYDAIHFRSAWGGLPICQRKGALESRLIYDVAISPLAQPRPADGALAAATEAEERYCMQQADVVVVPSEFAKKHVLSSGITRPVHVVSPGVDIDLFDWESAPLGHQPYVLYAGRLGPGRGIRILLRAFREVSSQTDARLVLVGPVEHGFGPTLQTSIRESGLTGCVDTVGSVEHVDLPRLLAVASVCVAPRVPDPNRQPLAGCPIKVLEYMACRRPVVVPSCPLMEEVEGGSGCFAYFKGESAGDLASAIIRLLGRPKLAEQVADAGYDRVRTAFTASNARRQLNSVYQRLLPRAASLAGRPGLDSLPGVLSADPETSTARRFREFHDTATVSEPAPRGGWTPTRERPARRRRPHPALSREAGGEPGDPMGERATQRIEPQSTIEVIDEVDEVDEADFVAAGDLLSHDVDTGAREEPTNPDFPSESKVKPPT